MKLTTFKSTFILSVLALGLSFSAKADEASLTFHSDFKKAEAAAKKEGKPIITIFSATWCPPCQTMKKKVYPSNTIKPFHKEFVWAYLDADVSANRKLMNKYGVEGIPHIAFLSSDSKQIGKTVGGMDAKTFAKVLTDVLKRAKAM